MKLFHPFCMVSLYVWQTEAGQLDERKPVQKPNRPPRPQFTATHSSTPAARGHPRPPRPHRPKPSNSVPQHLEATVKYQPGCMLERPSLQAWNSGANNSVVAWVNKEFDEYYKSDYGGFHLYMRDKYAPDLVASSFICQGIGACSIVDCKDIAENITSQERQMAYYTFESIANVDLIAKMIKDAIDDAASDIQHRSGELVDRFTWIQKTREKALSEARAHKIANAAIMAVFLVAMAVLGVLGSEILAGFVGIGAVLASKLAAAGDGVSFVGNTFIGLTNLADKLGPEDPNFVQEAREHFQRSWNVIATGAEKSIREDTEAYMNGDVNMTIDDITIADLIGSGDFVEIPPGLNNDLHELVQRWFMAVAIDGLWSTEPVYILDTNENFRASCENDRRGPARNKVCLPERPGHVYWLYSMLEATRDIASPPGLKTLLDNPERFSNITKEDIVRSSLWVAENKLEDVVRPYRVTTVPGADHMLYEKSSKNGGSLPGAFTVPICRNPTGEAISSVWSKTGRNYPCRCGNIMNWQSKGYTYTGLEESKFFYEQTGFYASEEFEDECENHMKCKGENDHDWHFNIPEGYPPKAKGMKHVWKRCKKLHAHHYDGNPDQDQ